MGALLRMSPQAIARRQLPLLEVANQIMRITQQGAARGYAGYGDVTISVPSDKVVLYWHGSPPAALRQRLARMQATAAIQVLPATYTWQQLEAQAHQIAAHQSTLSTRGYVFSSAGPDPAAGGVRLGIDYAHSRTLAAVTQAARPAAVQAAVRQVAAGPAPVTVFDAPRAMAFGTRHSDTPPFWGGNRIVRIGDIACSSGFSVSIGGNQYMLTAGHCGGINTPWQTPGTNAGDVYNSGGSFVGVEVNRAGCCDSAIIQVTQGEQGLIYDKGWNSTAGEQVLGALAAVTGSLTCTEGATSGVRCGVLTGPTGQIATFQSEGGGSFTAVNETEGTSVNDPDQETDLVTASGDSGGPVIINSGILGDVYAAGTISGGSGNQAFCIGIDPDAANRGATCTSTVWFEEMIPILNLWGAVPLTGP